MFGPRSALTRMNSFPPQPTAFLSEASGDFPRRDMVGRPAASNRFGSRLQKAGCYCARRCAESQPYRDNCLRAADQQSEVGHSAWECPALGSTHGFAKRFGGECLPDSDNRQESFERSRRETASFEAGVGALRNLPDFGQIRFISIVSNRSRPVVDDSVCAPL
jgi:hypothetical protein